MISTGQSSQINQVIIEKLMISYIMVGQHRVNLAKVRKFDELYLREDKEEQCGEPVEDLVEVTLFEEDLTKTYKIGSIVTG